MKKSLVFCFVFIFFATSVHSEEISRTINMGSPKQKPSAKKVAQMTDAKIDVKVGTRIDTWSHKVEVGCKVEEEVIETWGDTFTHCPKPVSLDRTDTWVYQTKELILIDNDGETFSLDYTEKQVDYIKGDLRQNE